jgi:hypothetical protein
VHGVGQGDVHEVILLGDRVVGDDRPDGFLRFAGSEDDLTLLRNELTLKTASPAVSATGAGSLMLIVGPAVLTRR